MTTTCRLLTREEFTAAEDQRFALAKSRNDGRGASLKEILPPGSMWFCYWYLDPSKPEDVERAKKYLEQSKLKKLSFYARFYLETWSLVRPPISVLCPSGSEWCVDQVSSNGEGWQVTGDPPRITCQPSIVVPGYHGFLRDGVFTPNM
jgi:hypothetical protein